MVGRDGHAALWPSLKAMVWPTCVSGSLPFLPGKRTSRQHRVLGKASGSGGGGGGQREEPVAPRGYGLHRRHSRCTRLAHTAPHLHALASLNTFLPVGDNRWLWRGAGRGVEGAGRGRVRKKRGT